MKKLKYSKLALILIVFLLSGCSQTVETAESKVVQDLSNLAHIHSVATDGKDIYAATHHGLYVWQGNDWMLRGDDFDIMGLSFNNGIFFASGHPGPLQNLPDPVGVLTSENGGAAWTPLSLTGEVDFHLLEVADQYFIGAAASHNAVMKSTDGGITWSTISTPGFSDLSLNPNNPKQLLLADSEGLLLSVNFGKSFKSIKSERGISFIEWHKSNIFAASKNSLFKGADLESDLSKSTYKFKEIIDIHAEGEIVVVMDSEGIHVSRDLGSTFEFLAKL